MVKLHRQDATTQTVQVSNLDEVRWLTGLEYLGILWLSDNPCATDPRYEEYIKTMVPSLQKLDNASIDRSSNEQILQSISQPASAAVALRAPAMQPGEAGASATANDEDAHPLPCDPCPAATAAANADPRCSGDVSESVNDLQVQQAMASQAKSGDSTTGERTHMGTTSPVVRAVCTLLEELECRKDVHGLAMISHDVGHRLRRISAGQALHDH
jgi:hypothetical protein